MLYKLWKHCANNSVMACTGVVRYFLREVCVLGIPSSYYAVITVAIEVVCMHVCECVGESI